MTFRWIALLLVIGAGLGYLALRPVCVPLSSEELATLDPPIEARSDRDFYVRIFQFRDGRWHQCRTWLSRQLFF